MKLLTQPLPYFLTRFRIRGVKRFVSINSFAIRFYFLYLVLKHVQYLSIKLTLSTFILNTITVLYTKTAVDSK